MRQENAAARDENAAAHETRRHAGAVLERLSVRDFTTEFCSHIDATGKSLCDDLDGVREQLARLDENIDRSFDGLHATFDKGFAETKALIEELSRSR